MSEHRYIHSTEREEVELGRLAMQSGIIDPVTTRRLAITGVAQGWKCLEVGAGAGSIAEWLSKRVGATGKVVATDIDLRFLRRKVAANMEIRHHDILKDDLELSHYDLVHCRLVLMHLPEPERALRKMADAVRPGGWLVVEEYDYGSSLSTDVSDQAAAPFTKLLRDVNSFAKDRGIDDPYFGRRLRGLIEGLGYDDMGQEGWTRMYRGGEFADLWVSTFQVGAPLVLAAGVVTQEQLDSLYHLFMDPAFNWIGPTLFCAWGRKPAKGGRS